MLSYKIYTVRKKNVSVKDSGSSRPQFSLFLALRTLFSSSRPHFSHPKNEINILGVGVHTGVSE